jgi:hypothetical protein
MEQLQSERRAGAFLGRDLIAEKLLAPPVILRTLFWEAKTSDYSEARAPKAAVQFPRQTATQAN